MTHWWRKPQAGLFIAMLTLTSCSWLSHRETIDEQTSATPAPSETVSREQYEQLLAKYEALAAKVNQGPMAEQSVAERQDSTSLLQALKESPMPVVETAKVAQDTVSLNDPSNTQLRQQFVAGRESGLKIVAGDLSREDVQNELKQFYEADKLFSEQKWKEALDQLKKTEQSRLFEVRAWSKYLMGEVFFSQGEYDLAGQLFEEVVRQYSGSGVVVKTLGRLIVCAEKLGQTEKKDRYYSLLHDFFE